MIEIAKAAYTVSEGDMPPLAKLFLFAMFCAMVLIMAVAMGRI